MTNSYSEGSPMVWLAWIHLAFMLIPLIVLMLDIEWHDWRREHPRRSRLALPRLRQGQFDLAIHFSDHK